jgi:hypothetical protein
MQVVELDVDIHTRGQLLQHWEDFADVLLIVSCICCVKVLAAFQQ